MHDTNIIITKFWVYVGVVNLGKGLVCVAVNTAPLDINGIIQPKCNFKYAVHTVFKFSALKRTVFRAIIAALQTKNIYPKGSKVNFCPPQNPSNRYYFNLCRSQFADILQITRESLSCVAVNEIVETKMYPNIPLHDHSSSEIEEKKLSPRHSILLSHIGKKTTHLNIGPLTT